MGTSRAAAAAPHNTYWFSDGYADYLRGFNWAMALPIRPCTEASEPLTGLELRRALGLVQAQPRVVLDLHESSHEVLRLRFRPVTVIGGEMTVEPAGGGDYVVRVRHEHAHTITVAGS